MTRVQYYLYGAGGNVFHCFLYSSGPILFGFSLGRVSEWVLDLNGVSFSIWALIKFLMLGFLICYSISIFALFLSKRSIEAEFSNIFLEEDFFGNDNLYVYLLDKWKNYRN